MPETTRCWSRDRASQESWAALSFDSAGKRLANFANIRLRLVSEDVVRELALAVKVAAVEAVFLRVPLPEQFPPSCLAPPHGPPCVSSRSSSLHASHIWVTECETATTNKRPAKTQESSETPALVWSQRHQRETLPLLGISLLVRSCTTPYTAFCVSCRQRRSAVRGDNCWQQGSPALASSPRWTYHQMRLTCCLRRGPAISPISPRSHTSGARTKSCESGPPVAMFGPSPSGCTNSNTACTPCCRCHQRAACRTRQCPSYRSRNMETPLAMALGAEALPMAAVEAGWRRHRRPRLGCPLHALYCFAKAATHGVVGMFDESVMFVIAFAWLSGLPTRFGDTFFVLVSICPHTLGVPVLVGTTHRGQVRASFYKFTCEYLQWQISPEVSCIVRQPLEPSTWLTSPR